MSNDVTNHQLQPSLTVDLGQGRAGTTGLVGEEGREPSLISNRLLGLTGFLFLFINIIILKACRALRHTSPINRPSQK